MKSFLTLLISLITILNFFSVFAQTGSICNSDGNVVIYSNYDGGILNINVDQNIPNLKVGITTYEKTQIIFTGPFVGNIVQVVYTGFDGQNNHCPPSFSSTSITGVPSNITTINTSNNLQTATRTNSYGYSRIICNYSCNSTSSQGGCNTPDQIVDYYLNLFGGKLFSHFTQYGCWSGTYNVSNGGNCCIGSELAYCAPPASASVITGRSAICEGEINVSYAISYSADATGYEWTVPSGASIVSGINTNTITVQFPKGSQNGSITVVPKNNCGNGSSSTINLTVNKATSSPISPTVCNTYTAPDGAVYTSSGTYSAKIPNASGCDSTITINLTVKKSTSSTISPTVCNSYTAPDGVVYTTSGSYTAIIPNVAGCDSIIIINLKVNKATSSTISPTVCNTYTAPDGAVYTTSGTYTAKISNAAGCDSTITINLTVNKATSSTISPTVCNTYTAPDGAVYTTSGTYTAKISNASGCDSTITINLTVKKSTSSTISPTVCNTYTAPDGAVYTSSGTYSAKISNAAGCDSTITINLTVKKSTSSTISPTVCNVYTAPDGAVYTTSGTYTAKIPNDAGCDSTITINLTVKKSTSSTISPTVCNTYTAPDGAVYTSSGTYSAKIPNAAGCDSTITINLTVNKATSSTISPTVCNSYTAPDGAVYTTSGTYTAKISNAAGCDSTITINLTVKKSTSSTISPTVCNSYTAPDGLVYTTSGTYTAKISNASGCDSTITINLTVIPSPVVNAGSDLTICEGNDVVLSASGALKYTWNNGVSDGITFKPSLGKLTYTVTGTDVYGCSATDAMIINVLSSPKIQLNALTPSCIGKQDATVFSQVTGGSGSMDYLWSTGASTPNLINIGKGNYTLTVTESSGCSATATVSVNEGGDPCFVIPGGLSPNGDNVNDIWTIPGLNGYPQADVKVFNRWGQQVYQGDGQSAAWDGTFGGKEMPTADYYYTIDLGNGERFNGVVTLKR
jgi:gliding motility-associated-like protein